MTVSDGEDSGEPRTSFSRSRARFGRASLVRGRFRTHFARPEGVRSAFERSPERFCCNFGSLGPLPGRPGHRFSSIFVPLFVVFRSDGAFARKTSDINKTLAGVVQNALRSFRATSRKRQKSLRRRSRRRSATRTGSTSAPGRPGTASGPFLERSRAVLEWPGAVLERPGASQERSWAVPGASWTAPGASCPRPGASPNRPGAPQRLQDRFWSDFCSIFRHFRVDFPWIFAFRMGLVRCFRRACSSRREACAVAGDKALTS